MQLLTQNNFTDFIKHNGFTVVLFSWDLCKSCIGLKEQLKPIAQQIPCGVVEVSENIQLADRFKNGREVDRIKGYFTTTQLKEWLNL